MNILENVKDVMTKAKPKKTVAERKAEAEAKRVKLPKVTIVSPMIGCDPEFFFSAKGDIIGAEQVLPKAGLNDTTGGSQGKVIIDGVQGEINPEPAQCRVVLGSNIAVLFQTLKNSMAAKKGEEIKAVFSQAVEITKDKLLELSEESRKFGCAPSKSNYKSSFKIDDINPEEYLTRAAGGHIHLGFVNHDGLKRAFTTDVKKTVTLLDIILGNTCVLIDRDPSNIERRKVYGKAGEYRTPTHGLEYRTLSNFWLQSYQLMSLVTGLARLAAQLMADPRHEEFYKAFLKAVDIENVQKAIDNNDYCLALENFKAIEPLLLDVSINAGHHPIDALNIHAFHHFVAMIQENGLKYWFATDPIDHWINRKGPAAYGFYDFLQHTVILDMDAKHKAKVQAAA